MKANLNNGELILHAPVGFDFWGEDGLAASDVREAISSVSGDLTVRINSGGGDAMEGAAIHAVLSDYPGRLTMVVEGVAASAASLIAMAGDEIVMTEGALMMIHDPSALMFGTADEMRAQAEALDVIADTYAQVYGRRSGKSAEESREIMKRELWMGPEAAVENGFADRAETKERAAAAAAFPYHKYESAPDRLVAMAAEKKWGAEGLRRMKAAMPAAQKARRDDAPVPVQEALMAKDKMEDPAGAAAPVVEATPSIESVEKEMERPTMAVDTKKIAAEAVRAERERSSAIMQAVRKARLGDDVADKMIEDGVSINDARAQIIEMWADAVPAGGGGATRPTVNVIRDERATMRAGMTASLVAQIARKDPESDEARDYMDLGIVDMAARAIGWDRPIRTTGDRLAVMEAGMHSTSDFPAIFENALNKVLLERYAVQEPTYRQIARRRDFLDFRPHPMVRSGDFPQLQPVGEAGEIKWGTFSDNKETAVLTPYGVGLSISRHMLVNDDLGAIGETLGDYGAAVAHFEEAKFYAFMASATLSDSKAVFHDDHDNLASAGAAISVTTLSAGRAAIRKQTTLDGQKANLSPRYILVSPDNETLAQQFVVQITPDTASNVNVFSGSLEPVVTAHLTGKAWYLFADPAQPGGACFVYGYLNGASAPRLRMDEPFGRQGVSMTVEHDFGLGAIDYRGAYKNPQS